MGVGMDRVFVTTLAFAAFLYVFPICFIHCKPASSDAEAEAVAVAIVEVNNPDYINTTDVNADSINADSINSGDINATDIYVDNIIFNGTAPAENTNSIDNRGQTIDTSVQSASGNDININKDKTEVNNKLGYRISENYKYGETIEGNNITFTRMKQKRILEKNGSNNNNVTLNFSESDRQVLRFNGIFGGLILNM